jgi:hypothetical protein
MKPRETLILSIAVLVQSALLMIAQSQRRAALKIAESAVATLNGANATVQKANDLLSETNDLRVLLVFKTYLRDRGYSNSVVICAAERGDERSGWLVRSNNIEAIAVNKIHAEADGDPFAGLDCNELQRLAAMYGYSSAKVGMSHKDFTAELDRYFGPRRNAAPAATNNSAAPRRRL